MQAKEKGGPSHEYGTMEHTFGNEDLSFDNSLVNAFHAAQEAYPIKLNNQGDTKLTKKERESISLSTDSMFNVQDEEVKHQLSDTLESHKKEKQQDNIRLPIPEVEQLLQFIAKMEKLWADLASSEYAGLLKHSPEKVKGNKQASTGLQQKPIPSEISSQITHQITQITVFYQLNAEKEGFRIPTKKVSSLAMLAKRIVIQDQINIPRQTRS